MPKDCPRRDVHQILEDVGLKFRRKIKDTYRDLVIISIETIIEDQETAYRTRREEGPVPKPKEDLLIKSWP